MSAAVYPPSQPQQTPPSARDPYASTTSASPSARRPVRSSTTTANAAPNTSTTQTYLPTTGSGAMTAPRATDTMSSSTYQQFYPDSAVPGPAIALPVRTSSQRAPTTAAYDGRALPAGPPQQSTGTSSHGGEFDRARVSEQQRAQASPRQDSRSGQRAPAPSRSATAIGQPPVDTSLPRENSAIIQHIVVDDPQTDILREKARVAESRPTHIGSASSAPLMAVEAVQVETEKPRTRQDFRQGSSRKEVKFGDYILGQTLGEGEFGKVKMGWKKDSNVQVAIKVMHKESLQSASNRLPKIYREISILRGLQHPNIVRLHEFVETERHMGIILEYASGGELFDYILTRRYLKDPAARRLFAQLVSGVGYLHKKGIVHRDLKLENLLLDRNKNIIITDFGFANTFNPNEELGEEVEARIGDKEYVKRHGLEKVNEQNQRRGDLMQTSCGSPCYAAPELVVSDGLYTGRKVDVWSCGVILVRLLLLLPQYPRPALTTHSTPCSPATSPSTTTPPTRKATTSTSSTNTSCRRPSPSPNTSPRTPATSSAKSSSRTPAAGPTSSPSPATAG